MCGLCERRLHSRRTKLERNLFAFQVEFLFRLNQMFTISNSQKNQITKRKIKPGRKKLFLNERSNEKSKTKSKTRKMLSILWWTFIRVLIKRKMPKKFSRLRISGIFQDSIFPRNNFVSFHFVFFLLNTNQLLSNLGIPFELNGSF